MFERIRKKLNNSRGFSLTELLVAVAILMLLGVAVTVMVSTGLKVYNDSLYISESRSVQDTINSALSDFLRFASIDSTCEKSASPDADGNYKLTKGEFLSSSNAKCSLKLNNAGYIILSNASTDTPILNMGSYAGMYADDFELLFNPDSKIFTCKYTLIDKNDNTLPVSYTVRTISQR